MTEYVVLELIKETFWLCILLSTPILVLGMLVGILISIIQTATSIQEQSLTTVPKLIITVLAIMGLSRWMLSTMMTFAIKLLGSLQNYANF